MVELTVETTPPGATIILNGVEIGTTNTKVMVPKTKSKPSLKLVLHGYVDETVKALDLESSSSVARVLKKVRSEVGVGGPGPLKPPPQNPGKGSNTTPPPVTPKNGSNDTGLMRPGD